MLRFDLPLEDLLEYRPDIPTPDDFDPFWKATLDSSAGLDLGLEIVEVETPYRTVRVRDVRFRGYGGDVIAAWLTTPITDAEPLPAVVEFLGYNGGRDVAGAHLHWASAGFAHLVVDTRGQGGAFGGPGDSPDPHGSGPSAPGFLTRGINSEHDYYYRRVFVDGVRAVQAARSLPGVDARRVAVHGVSQGGGIALAVAGLSDEVAAVLPDVPFLCHFRRALELCTEDPYAELVRYLAVHRDQTNQVLDTLAYFDGANFARRTSAPALFSVALRDEVCPPSTVFAAHNHFAGPKDIEIYPYNAHEGGQNLQRLSQIRWLSEVLDA